MKKTVLRCGALLLLAILLPACLTGALESTAKTRTISMDGAKLIATQDAYFPAGDYCSEAKLSSPEDLYYRDGVLYIADSGNGRIVAYTLATGALSFLGEDILVNPTGLVVAPDGRVFVADYGASEIVVLSADGAELLRIPRPQEIYYGNSPYKPRKIDIDSYGNIYAVSEGTHEGILQFNSAGEFNGFFGANKTSALNLVEWFQKVFYTDEQKAKMLYRTPPNIYAIDAAPNDLIFSVSLQTERREEIKQLNMAGVNAMPKKLNYSDDYVDVTVADTGYFVAVTATGSITEYRSDGTMLVTFGGRASTTDRNGLTAVASAIEMDEAGNLFVLDRERGLIQAWYPSDYARLLHLANDTFDAGDYEGSLTCYEEVLHMNPSAYMAHEGYAAALFQLGRYDEAAEHYRIIYNAEAYSDCYWEIRSEWLRVHMRTILIILFILLALAIGSRLFRRYCYDYLAPLAAGWAAAKKRHPLLKQTLSDPLYLLRHPIDGVYELKIRDRGSPLAAGILYVAALAVYMVSRAGTSFVFHGGLTAYNNPGAIALIVLVPATLFVVGSYLISSINDGEGTFVQAFTAIGYALTPFILFTPFLALLSHVMTYTELFIYQLLQGLILAYTCIMVFLAVKETQAYTPRKTVGNVLLTIAFIVLSILAVIVLYLLWRELLGFVGELFEEVKYRVFS